MPHTAAVEPFAVYLDYKLLDHCYRGFSKHGPIDDEVDEISKLNKAAIYWFTGTAWPVSPHSPLSPHLYRCLDLWLTKFPGTRQPENLVFASRWVRNTWTLLGVNHWQFNLTYAWSAQPIDMQTLMSYRTWSKHARCQRNLISLQFWHFPCKRPQTCLAACSFCTNHIDSGRIWPWLLRLVLLSWFELVCDSRGLAETNKSPGSLSCDTLCDILRNRKMILERWLSARASFVPHIKLSTILSNIFIFTDACSATMLSAYSQSHHNMASH